MQFEGKIYERRSGVWYDCGSHMRVSVQLGGELDRLARTQPEALADDAAPLQRALPHRATTRGRRANSSQWLDHSFSGDGRQLLLVPKLREGWRFHKKTACLCERILIDSMHDRRVSAQLALFPRPGLLDSERAADWFPRLSDTKGPSGGSFVVEGKVLPAHESIRYRVVDGKVEISIDLLGDDDGFNPALDWKTKRSGKPRVHWQGRELLGAAWLRSDHAEEELMAAAALLSSDALPFNLLVGPLSQIQLQLWLIAEPRPLRSPLSIEWSRRFFPGGLPSLGRRR